MTGWIAGVGAAGTAIGGGLTLLGQGQQASQQAQAMQVAQQNYLLQQKMAQQQYELSTASRRDARGDVTSYVPGQGWTTTVTPTVKGIINSSDAITQDNLAKDITQGRPQRDQAFKRGQNEGETANAMLAAIQNGYGKPHAQGVAGANTIAGVTGANEIADNMKSGMAAAALRSGGSTVPLASNFSALDRNATNGTRSAIAQSKLTSPGMYNAQLEQYNANTINPYNTMATRADNPSGVPFQPENLSAGIDNQENQAAGLGQQTLSRGSPGAQTGANSMIAALLAQKQPDYGTFAGGLTANLKNLIPMLNGTPGSGGAWNVNQPAATSDPSTWTGGF